MMEVVAARRSLATTGIDRTRKQRDKNFKRREGYTGMNRQWWWQGTRWMLVVAMEVWPWISGGVKNLELGGRTIYSIKINSNKK